MQKGRSPQRPVSKRNGRRRLFVFDRFRDVLLCPCRRCVPFFFRLTSKVSAARGVRTRERRRRKLRRLKYSSLVLYNLHSSRRRVLSYVAKVPTPEVPFRDSPHPVSVPLSAVRRCFVGQGWSDPRSVHLIDSARPLQGQGPENSS